MGRVPLDLGGGSEEVDRGLLVARLWGRELRCSRGFRPL